MDNQTTVVNIHHKTPYDVYIGRAGKGQDGYFGNPIPLIGLTRQECLTEYRKYFYKRINSDSEFKQRILTLKGKVLGCFCYPKECHGDVIAEYLNSTV